MPKQIKNSEAMKLRDEASSDARAEKTIEKVAEKSTRTFLSYEKGHAVFSE
jgi:hypothetical protein